MTTTPTATAATPKQVAFLSKLAAERPTWTDHLNGLVWERCWDALGGKYISKGEASAVIDALLAMPKPAATPKANGNTGTKADPGIYLTPEGRVVKVQQNKAKTNVYALVWREIGGERLTETDERVHGEWEYSPGLVFQVQPDWRMTLDQAKEFTLRYGQCVRCGRHLKAAESVDQGIGPVCRKEFTW